MKYILAIFTWIKGRNVVLDDRVPISYLISFMLEKGLALTRGVVKTRKLVLLGRGTTIRGVGQFDASRGSEIGTYCQIDCLSHIGMKLGKGSKIGHFSIVKVSGSLSDLGQKIIIGDNVGIGEFAHIGGAGPVIIGSDTISGSYLSIHPENHNFGDTTVPIRLQGVTHKGISIGQGCWIGAKVTFLDGSSIGDRCVVAAGAVVTRNFPSDVLIGGLPAKILRQIGGISDATPDQEGN